MHFSNLHGKITQCFCSLKSLLWQIRIFVCDLFSWMFIFKNKFVGTSRYGDADQQASLFGTLLTLSQFLQHSQNNQSNKDVLRCIFAGSRRIVFVPSDLMVMVIVSHSAPDQLDEPTHSLVLQLTYVYNQVSHKSFSCFYVFCFNDWNYPIDEIKTSIS